MEVSRRDATLSAAASTLILSIAFAVAICFNINNDPKDPKELLSLFPENTLFQCLLTHHDNICGILYIVDIIYIVYIVYMVYIVGDG